MKWLKKLLFLPPVLIMLFVLLSAVALTAVFTKGMDSSPLAYAGYAFSFYSLCVLFIFCWKTLPVCWKYIKKRLYANKHTKRYLTDAAFKTHVNLFRSLAINLLFAVVNAAAAISFSTHWFAQFGGDMSLENQRIMIMATGAGIAVIVVTMAVYMIVRTTKEIRSLKYNGENSGNL